MKKKLLSKIIATGSALALTASLLTGCGGEKAAEKATGPVPIKVGYSPAVCQAAVFVAYEKGFFAEEGLSPEMVQVDAAHVNEAVGAGQIDVFQGLTAKMIQPLENGIPVKGVLGLHTGCVRILVPGDSPVQTVADLKGKKIGVAGLADSGTIIARRALYNAGVGVTERNMEVEFSVFNRNDLPQALMKGAVDAIAVNDPVGPIAAKEYGLRTLVDTAKTAPFDKEYCCVAFVTSKLATEQPETAAKIVRALEKASQWVQQHPKETAELELDRKYVSGSVDMNLPLIESYNYNPSVQGGYDAIKNVAGELANIGLIKDSTDGDAFAKEHFTFFADVPDKPGNK